MTTAPTDHAAATAAAFLQGLADQDFAQLGGALAADARLRALLPKGLRDFGDTEDFELVEAALGDVGRRLQLRWRLRLRAERLGAGWFTVEQQAYADAGEDGRLARIDLVCTGYRPEADDG
jgi:hypothetical protein